MKIIAMRDVPFVSVPIFERAKGQKQKDRPLFSGVLEDLCS